jgi:hypothetical protein
MLHIISSLFNSSGYRTPLRNYFVFLEQFRLQNIPFTIAELSFDGNFSIPEPSGAYPNHKVVRLNGGAVLWQKGP